MSNELNKIDWSLTEDDITFRRKRRITDHG